MKLYPRLGLLLLVMLLVGLVLPALAQAAAEGLTPEQKRELQGLLREFRAARSDQAKRAELTDQILALGHEAATPFMEIVGKELYPQLNSYRDRFLKAAGAVAGTKAKSVNLQELAQLRQMVLTLSQQETLTKEMIQNISDPAIQRLEAMLVVDRDSILDGNPALVKQRESLLPLGALWEKCAVYLASQDVPADQETLPERPNFEKYLQGDEDLTTRLAMPMDAPTRQILAANSALSSRLDPEEARCVLACNLMRNLLGLNACQIDPALVATARDHSLDMERLKFFAHESPLPGKTTPWDRAKRFNTSASGENIAAGYQDGTSVNLGWWHSPGHHKNMLGSHNRIGVGRHNRHWTELFGR